MQRRRRSFSKREAIGLLDALHLVTGVDDRTDEHGILHRVSELRNSRAGIKIDDGVRYALDPLERLLHVGDAMRAHHSLNGKLLFHDDLLIRGRTRIDYLDILLGYACIRSFLIRFPLFCNQLLRRARAKAGLPRTQTQRIRDDAYA